MTLTITTLQCVRCGATMRAQITRPTPPGPCPICRTDTVIVISSRPMNDPVQVPDRREIYG